MARRNNKGRYKHGGRYLGDWTAEAAEARGTLTSSIMSEAFTSESAMERAADFLKSQGNVKSDVAKFATATVALWGRPCAPDVAADFWRHNERLDPMSKAFVPEQFRNKLGAMLGWAVVEHQKPADQGGDKDETMGLFSPVRMQAGILARTALL